MKKHFLLYAKGMAMGAADVVPGVSGGTIAFISGIYDELLRSIASVPEAALLLLRGRIKDAWRMANATFLLVLLGGILTSILSFARLITYLLEHQPIPVWSFFFGLILVSAYMVGRDIHRWNWSRALSFLLGLAFAYWITVAAPVQWGSDPLSLFCAGAIAICAMILPGISGSFILVMLGMYTEVLGAVNDRDFTILIAFTLGCVVGLALFSTLLNWLLERYHRWVLAAMIGLMIGSTRVLWPWPNGTNTTTMTLPREDVVVPFVIVVVGAAVVVIVDLIAVRFVQVEPLHEHERAGATESAT
jgi:putative membrane protein